MKDTQQATFLEAMEVRDLALKRNGSTADGTDDREARSKIWYVARVQMHCEKKTAQKISSLGYETYVPIQEEIRQWSDRKKKIERILIPLVVFFQADENGANEVKRLSCVYDLLKSPGAKLPATIPDDQIKRLKFMIGSADEEITIGQSLISKGDKVQVIRGSLRGLEGYALSTQDGNTKISIVIEDLFCASVKINPRDLMRLANNAHRL